MRHAVAPAERCPNEIVAYAAKRNAERLSCMKDTGPASQPQPATNLKHGGGMARKHACPLERLYGSHHRFDLANETAGGFVVDP